MDSLPVTPSSKADLQLLTALFKKMKAQVLPAAAPAEFVPQNQAEANVLEMREVLAGRKKVMSLKQFLDWCEQVQYRYGGVVPTRCQTASEEICFA